MQIIYDIVVSFAGNQDPSPYEDEIEHCHLTMGPVTTPSITTVPASINDATSINAGASTNAPASINDATSINAGASTNAPASINAAVTTSAVPVHDYEATKPLPSTPKGVLQRGLPGNLPEKVRQVKKAVHEVNDWARPLSDFFKFPTPPMVNLAIVGNPGIGKSTILNALGGIFDHGYSEVSGLTTSVSKQQVTFNHIQLQLYDIPGIDDSSPDGNDSIVKHLQMVQHSLNERGPFIILFVSKPTNGRISPSDYMIMKTVIDSLKESPQVGFILTHARPRDIHHYRSQHYTKMMLAQLEKIVEPRCKRFLSRAPPLVLADHDKNGFSEEEKQMIFNFITSFDPKRVESRNMVEQIVRSFFAMANSGFA